MKPLFRNVMCLKALLCLSLLTGEELHAQDQGLVLQLEELFRIAETHNSSVKSFESAIDVADAAYRSALTSFLPDVETQVAVSYNGNGRIWNRDFTQTHMAKIPHFGNMAQLRLNMPIYTGGAIRSGVTLSRQVKQMAELNANENRSNIKMMITKLYLTLHSLKNQEKVFDDNIILTEQIVSMMKKRCNEGIVLSNDVTRYELLLEKLKLGRVQTNYHYKTVYHQLMKALGEDAEIVFQPDTSFQTNAISINTENDWLMLARQHAHGLKKASLTVEMNKEKVRMERAALLPTIGFEIEDNLTGPVTIEIPVLNKNFNYWYVGVGVKYTVSSLFKSNKKVKQARLQVGQSENAQEVAMDQIDIAVQEAYTEYQTSLAGLRSHQKNVQLATESFNVVRNRYENGLVLITDMLDAANEKLDAELQLVDARIHVIENYYYIKYLSGIL